MIFSLVELTTNTGIIDRDLMSNIPDVDDIKCSKLYKELVEDCGGSKYISVSIIAVEIGSQKATLIEEIRYAIIPEKEFIYTRREENEIQRRNLC